MRKYLHVAGCEIQNSLIYRGNTWLTAFFSIFTVLLAYLLWSAVFGSSKTFNGFTLPQMVTYYLLSNILSPLMQSDGLLNTFTEEIKNGSYSKYIVKPISPIGYFMSAGFARTLYPIAASTLVLTVVMIVFNGFFEAVSLINIVKALPVILLGAVLNMLISFIITMATFKFTDIGFLILVQTIIKMFLSGSLIPLSLVFGDQIAMWSPFSYTLYYPVMLILGKAETSFTTALIVLTAWILVTFFICLILKNRAPKAFEGVGM